MSELFGRECWVADSMLKLIESHVDTLYEQNRGEVADDVLASIRSYCKELRDKNKNHFDDFIDA